MNIEAKKKKIKIDSAPKKSTLVSLHLIDVKHVLAGCLYCRL